MKQRKFMRLTEIAEHLDWLVSGLCGPESFYMEFGSTQCGDKIVEGPHITVSIPALAWKMKTAQDKKTLPMVLMQTFDHYHSEIGSVKVSEDIISMNGKDYMEITLVQEGRK